MVLFRHYVNSTALLLAVLETVLFGAVFIAAAWLLPLHAVGSTTLWMPPLGVALLTVCLVLCLTALGSYQPAVRRCARVTAWRLAIGGLLAVVAIVLSAPLHDLMPALDESIGPLALSVALACALAWLCRVLLLQAEFVRDRLKPRATIIGCGSRAARVGAVCAGGGRAPRLVSFLQPPALDAGPLPTTWLQAGNKRLPVEAFPEDLCASLSAQRVRQIIVALDERRGILPMQALLRCRMHGIRVIDSEVFLERVTGRIDLAAGNQSWLVFSDGFGASRVGEALRRAIDIAGSAALLLLTAPLMLGVALAVKFDSPGPVIYRQARVGRFGRTFSILKFRSMIENAERDGRAVWATTDDPRVTRIGRWIRLSRLDELPQLFNVLKGDMSLVGPRPERPRFVAELCRSIPFYNERHRIRPGITGWAQINHQYASTPEDNLIKTEYDLYYLKNRSVFLDLTILLQTVGIVVFREGSR